MSSLRRHFRHMPFQLALAFLVLLILGNGLAVGFVLCVGPQGHLALELESADCDLENLQGKPKISIPHSNESGSPRNSECCVDISALDEFPPIPSLYEKPPVPKPVLAFVHFPSRSTMESHQVFQGHMRPQGIDPLGPNPVATVRLTL